MPGGKELKLDGRYFEISGPSDTTVRVYANLFTGTLSTNLVIRNDGKTPLVVEPALLDVATPDGHSLEKSTVRLDSGTCVDRPGDKVILQTLEECRIPFAFAVQPDAKKLAKLVMTHRGVTREGVSVPISVQLEKD